MLGNALTALGTIILAYLTLRGAKITASRAKEGVEVSAGVAAQDSALKAWEGLLEPYKAEVASLRLEHEKFGAEISTLRATIHSLSLELGEWKRVARVLAKWAVPMRDKLILLGEIPMDTPEELLTLAAIDEMHAND